MSAISFRKALPILLVFAVAAFLLLAHLGAPPLDEAEARCALFARASLATGRLISPPVPDQAFWGCPLVGFWQPLPFALVLGLDELSVRLPSVLWAFALLLLTYDLGRRWFDDSTALLSAGALATTQAFVLAGRSATPDMAGAVAVLLSLWYFERHRSSGGRSWLYILGAILGAAGLLAGSGAYALALVCIVALSLARRDFAWVPGAGTVVLALLVSQGTYLALPIAQCIVGTSFFPFNASWPGEVAWRFLGTPVRRYADWNLFFYAPWSLLLPIALADALIGMRRSRDASLSVVALVGIAALWPAREGLGMVATAPLACLVAGRALARLGRGELARWVSHVTRLVVGAAGLALIAFLATALARSEMLKWLGDNWAIAGPLAFGGVVAVAGSLRKRPAELVVAAAAVWLGLALTPHHTRAAEIQAKAASVKQLGKPIGFLFPLNAQAAYYLDADYALHFTVEQATRAAEKSGGVLIASSRVSDPSWKPVAETSGWRALVWNPEAKVLSPTRDPAWLARHPLRGIKSETLTYVFRAESGIRFDLGTVTMKLAREEAKDDRELVIVAESRGGVPGYPMLSVVTSRLRDGDLAQIEADDLRTKPSFKHRRFTWLPEGVDYRRHDHCKDKACQNPLHMVRRRDGTQAHCTSRRCTNPDHRVWRLKEAFRQAGARDSWHVIAACYIARGFDLRPGAPPQVIRVINNDSLWAVAVRGVEERAIEVPAGKFQCVKIGFDATPLNEEARESADEAEGPFGLTGHADLYVDKATKLLVLLDSEIELGATFKVQVMLTKREAEAQQ